MSQSAKQQTDLIEHPLGQPPFDILATEGVSAPWPMTVMMTVTWCLGLGDEIYGKHFSISFNALLSRVRLIRNQQVEVSNRVR